MRSAQNYFRAIARAGGLPLALPHEVELAEAYLELLDGLVVTGGAFDLDPALYGDPARHPTVRTKDQRTAFELAITRAALARDLPVLGICGGQQLLNVVLGGDLVQHIPDAVAGALAHEQPNPRTEPGHEVQVLARQPAARDRGPTGSRSTAPTIRQPAGSAPASWSAAARPMAWSRRSRRPRGASAWASSGIRNMRSSVADDALFDALIAACRQA